MEVSSTQYPIARKEHICDWCNEIIPVGTAYRKQAIFDNGSAYSWKNHRHCDALADRLKMFDGDVGEGLSGSDFCDFITDEFRDIMFEKDGTTYNSKSPMPIFSERMKIVRAHHDL